MASILPGFEYDIFISYRQNDNRSGWVTEFVRSLEEELSATLKEPVSMYFDVNPHDGLLETHSVDKSLKEKLKCVIFIPILSQTYCDTKSFAWQHEFCAFSHIAREDSFGLDIKLPNGNIASRILPVRIHELEDTDRTTLEKEIGPIRSVDFIFKSAGVNRPLRAQEDQPQNNMVKVNYRDQINKLANAIKDLIHGCQQQPSTPQVHHAGDSAKNRTAILFPKKRVALIAILLLVALTLIFTYRYTTVSKTSSERISVAVLPFKVLSDDKDQQFFSYGIMEDIISKLYSITNLHVTSSTSSYAYQNSSKSLQQIANELMVNYLLEGSVRKAGDQVKISVRLVQASNDESIWTETYNFDAKNVFELQNDVAEKVVSSLNIKLTQKESRQFQKVQTTNPLALEHYHLGKYHNELSGRDNIEKSKIFFTKAIEEDAQFAAAYAGMAEMYISTLQWGYASPNTLDSVILYYVNKAISLDSLLGEAYSALGAYHTYVSHDFVKAEAAFLKGIELNPGYDFTYFHYSVLNVIMKNQAKALEFSRKALDLNPMSVKANGFVIQYAYYMFRQYDKAMSEVDKLLETFPDDNFALWVKAVILSQQGKYSESIQTFLSRSVSTKATNWALGYTYGKAGDRKKAEEVLTYLLAREKEAYIMPTFIAAIYVALDDKEKAFEYLERVPIVNDYWVNYYDIDPIFDPVRNDPRFKVIVDKALHRE